MNVKGIRKLLLGYAFLAVGGAMIILSLVLYRSTPENVAGIIAAVSASIVSLAGGVLSIVWGNAQEHKYSGGNNEQH